MTSLRPVAFLTLEDPTGFVMYDDLTFPPLAEQGFSVEMVPWTADADWSRFHAVIVRSTWDYQQAPEAFLSALEQIEAAGMPLANPLEVVRWNLDKVYLKDLEDRGVPIVPTVWGGGALGEALDGGRLEQLFAALGDAVVVKPTISANADDTFWLPRDADRAAALQAFKGSRPFMAQPFLPAITSEGEHSLFFFDGEYSHCVLKTPKSGDFRVQEEHGGILKAVTPEPALKAAADHAYQQLPEGLLQARLDFVRHDGGFVLMEAELIEPSLYFPYDERSPARFAAALARWVGRHRR
jgi:glutathione synthase/RimK-type ligase-like ATP-grasp enzyme